MTVSDSVSTQASSPSMIFHPNPQGLHLKAIPSTLPANFENPAKSRHDSAVATAL